MRYRLRTLLIATAPTGAVLLLACYFASFAAPPLATAIALADEITLYEGLPHPGYESKSFEHEQHSKAVWELEGYSFYKSTLTLQDGDGKKLAKILNDPATLEPFKGEKKCDGFHPDYAIQFRKGWSYYRVLICFGCGEVKILGPRIKSRYDMTRGAPKQLSTILRKYRANRPPRQLDEET